MKEGIIVVGVFVLFIVKFVGVDGFRILLVFILFVLVFIVFIFVLIVFLFLVFCSGFKRGVLCFMFGVFLVFLLLIVWILEIVVFIFVFLFLMFNFLEIEGFFNVKIFFGLELIFFEIGL